MRITFFVLVFVFVISLSHHSYSQGCSDAGVCTMEFSNHSEELKRNQVSASLIYGRADNSINVSTLSLEYQHLHETLGLISIRLSGTSLSGNGVSNLGLSDLFLSGSNTIAENLSILYGFKIPLSDGNTKKDNNALPLDYQTSLGTYDVFAGVKMEFDNFGITLAYQTPLSKSSNTFLPSLYSPGSDFSTYTSTKSFNRKADLVGRIDYNQGISETLGLVISLIPIYHVANDEAENNLGSYEIIGSKGLTLNGSVSGNLNLNNDSQISAIFAMPFKTRDVRPDGLTRAFVAQLKYSFAF